MKGKTTEKNMRKTVTVATFQNITGKLLKASVSLNVIHCFYHWQYKVLYFPIYSGNYRVTLKHVVDGLDPNCYVPFLRRDVKVSFREVMSSNVL